MAKHSRSVSPPSSQGPSTPQPDVGAAPSCARPLPHVPRRVVVKVGSAVLGTRLSGPDRMVLDGAVLLDLVQGLADLMEQGLEVVLVTSGAILSGMSVMGFAERPRLLPVKQACAAIGQIELMARYRDLFATRGIHVGQLLLTADDFRDRTRFLNARNTLQTLLEQRVLPIVNENDTVSVAEIKLGDNDNLSSLVINLLGADLLVLLSDVDGLFTADPKTVPEARRLSKVEEGDAMLADVPRSDSGVGSGGIGSKIGAVRRSMAMGTPAVIACGKHRGILARILAGHDTGTLFMPRRARLSSREHWIAFAPSPRASIRVDEGAAKALARSGKSLLPSGVKGVEGDFEMGDLVRIVGPGGEEIGRGLASYGADDVRRIAGLHSSQIETALGRKDFDEVIHRNNLVLRENTSGEVP